jgi:hypothetical protein
MERGFSIPCGKNGSRVEFCLVSDSKDTQKLPKDELM